MPSAVNNVLYNIVATYISRRWNRLKKREAECMPSISAHTAYRMVPEWWNRGVTMEVYNHITERARIENEIVKIDAVQVV